jgi:HPt (histidine-containing phosphotransfer) domain-containing protein
MGIPQKLQSFENFSRIGGGVALDVNYLNRATFGDKPLRSEIIGLFLAQVNGLARQLETPLDATAWRFLTHTLKGAASAVGAQYMAEIAAVWDKQPPPATGDERADCAAELAGAILAFEAAASNLH